MLEDVGTADQREEEAVDGAPEVGSVADVVHVAFGHVPAVQKVQRRKDVARNRDRDQVDVDAHLRLEENGRKQDGRNGSGGPYGIVVPIVLIFYKVPDGGNRDGADV